jgi:pimeloyl-ACP methyl ester carboxylesterase
LPRGSLQALGATLEFASVAARDPVLPTLIFLHEGLGALASWRDLPERLAAATGGAAFAYSRRGYGQSAPRPGPWPVSFMHEEARQVLPAVLAAQGLDDVVLVGHSDGASIALLFAAVAAEHGVRVRGLVLAAPHVFVEELCVRSIAQLRDNFGTSDLASKLERLHGDKAEATFTAWSDVWLSAEFRQWNIEDCLPAIRCPILVVQGGRDPFGTPPAAEPHRPARRRRGGDDAAAGGRASPAPRTQRGVSRPRGRVHAVAGPGHHPSRGALTSAHPPRIQRRRAHQAGGRTAAPPYARALGSGRSRAGHSD